MMKSLYRLICFVKRKVICYTLKKKGAIIGSRTMISDPFNVMIDATRPWLLTIGDYCVISRGVVILTHDYSLSTLRRVYGEWIGEGKETIIGDNVLLV